MDRNDAIVGQLTDRTVDNQVQTGFQLDPTTGDDDLDTDLWERFKAWANDPYLCDVAGERTFWEMERTVLRAAYVDGDIFALPTEEGSLQLVEADRCRSVARSRQNVVHGVKLDSQRRRLEYWFTRDVLDPFQRVVRVGDVERYSARDEAGNRLVFHIYNPKRVTQTRGVTAFAPVVDICGMFEDVNFAKLVQQQMVSCFAGFLERTADYKFGARQEQDESDYTTSTVEELSPGLFLKGKVGEKLNFPHSNVPNAEYFDHVRLLLTLIGINLGMPLVMVLMDAGETNFSGWRGAWNQAKLGFECNQKWLMGRFHAEVYRWKVRQWLESGELGAAAGKLGAKLFSHVWTPPKWDYIDPFKDAQADTLQLEKGLSSPRRIQNERGNNVEEIHDEIVSDNARLILAAHKKKEELAGAGVADVTWRDLLNPFATGTGAGQKPQNDDQEQPSNGNQKRSPAAK